MDSKIFDIVTKEFAEQLRMVITPMPKTQEEVISAVLTLLQPILYEGMTAMKLKSPRSSEQ